MSVVAPAAGSLFDMFEPEEDSIDTAFRLHMDQALQRAKAEAKARKRPRKRTGQYANDDPHIAFLRKRTCRLNYAAKVDGVGKALPELTKDKLVSRYNARRFGAALRNDQFRQHFSGDRTYFFWADPAARTPEILIMVDIDVREGSGTPEGARRFAEQVKEKVLPGMYFEPSTGGEGIHGYVVVEKAGVNVVGTREALKNLDGYLKTFAEATKADIACVEVKGQPPVIRYDDKGNIRDMTFGQFAKLPKGKGVIDTCKVTHAYLADLDRDEIVVETPPDEPAEKPTTPSLKVGSFDSRIVTQAILDEIPALEQYAAKLLVQWTGSAALKAGRWTVTAVDMAQFFAVMLAMKPNINDSLPLRRIGRLWEAVFLAGDFVRPWNHHRFKAIRDLLSLHGHIDWSEFRFQNVLDGRGRACRWSLGHSLRSGLLSLIEGGTTSVDTAASLPEGGHEFRVPTWYNFALEREYRWWEQAERQLNLLFAA